MDFEDPTIRQHFVSQTEQRLNAINPTAEERNQRIYRFRLIDRQAGALSLQSRAKISGNLLLPDLFSFDRVPESSLRANFERLFQEYERTIKFNTCSVLQKISEGNHNIQSEATILLRSKFLNFFRNPFCVKKVLNSLPDRMKNSHPTDPSHYRDYLRVLDGSKPQRKHTCKSLGISEQEYKEWLRCLFFMLNPMIDAQPNFYDKMINEILGNRETFSMVTVCTYTDKTCLLSDRGIVFLREDDEHDAWSFNLAGNAFITYSFGNIERFYHNHPGPKPPIPFGGMDLMKDLLKNRTCVVHYPDDLDKLEIYNQEALAQCHEHVYNSKKDCYGIHVTP